MKKMMTIFKKWFGFETEPETIRGDWSEKKLSNGNIVCTLSGATRSMCLLKPAATTEIYTYANPLELPTRRYFALLAALEAASLGYTPDELVQALAEVTKSAHKEKDVINARIAIQNACEAISARITGAITEKSMRGISRVLMVLPGENPFMFSDAFDEKKNSLLNTHEAANDFFLQTIRDQFLS